MSELLEFRLRALEARLMAIERHCEEVTARVPALVLALEEAVKTMNAYAETLNHMDGGHRPIYATTAAWVESR